MNVFRGFYEKFELLGGRGISAGVRVEVLYKIDDRPQCYVMSAVLI